MLVLSLDNQESESIQAACLSLKGSLLNFVTSGEGRVKTRKSYFYCCSTSDYSSVSNHDWFPYQKTRTLMELTLLSEIKIGGEKKIVLIHSQSSLQKECLIGQGFNCKRNCVFKSLPYLRTILTSKVGNSAVPLRVTM